MKLSANAHLAHRLGLLEGFCKAREGVPGPARCAMIDGAMVTCRSLWLLMGISVSSRGESNPGNPSTSTGSKIRETDAVERADRPPEIAVNYITKSEFEALNKTSGNKIMVVLVAANTCVAHLAKDPHHGATEEIIDRAIEITVRELESRVTVT